MRKSFQSGFRLFWNHHFFVIFVCHCEKRSWNLILLLTQHSAKILNQLWDMVKKIFTHTTVMFTCFDFTIVLQSLTLIVSLFLICTNEPPGWVCLKEILKWSIQAKAQVRAVQSARQYLYVCANREPDLGKPYYPPVPNSLLLLKMSLHLLLPRDDHVGVRLGEEVKVLETATW